MTRRFTDRDDVGWRVEWRGGQIGTPVPPDMDPQKVPLPPGGLHFQNVTFEFSVQMSKIDPNDLTEPELQQMIDDHSARNTGGHTPDPTHR